MRKLASRLTLVGVGLLVSIAAALPVQAIESFGIGALPANPRPDNPRTKSIFVYEVKPGEAVQDEIKLINNSPTTKTIVVYPVDSQASSDGAFACAQAVDERKAIGGWIKLDKSEVTLQPNSSEKVPFTVVVPSGIQVGEHNGCIAVQDASPSATTTTENGIVLSFRSAIRVAVTIPGKIVTELALVDVKSEQRDTKIQISPILKNTGNVSLDTKLDVSLKTLFGEKIGAANGEFPVLTETTSRFNFEVERPFWGGWYLQEVHATYAPLADAGNDAKSTELTTQKRQIFIAPHPLAATVEVGVPLLVLAGAIYAFRRQRSMKSLKASTVLYVIKKGDDVQSVARAHDIGWNRLAKLNRLKAPYTLKSDDTLLVPRTESKQKKPLQKD